MGYDPNQQYQQPQYPPPNQGYQQQPYQQPGYPPPGYQQPVVAPSPIAQQLGPSSIGIDANFAAALSYFWIIGLIFFFMEKQNKFVRFNALQSLLIGVSSWIVYIIFDFLPFPLDIISWPFGILWVVAAVYSQGGYPPQQGGYPPQQGGYPPQQGGYPPQQGGYPQQPPQGQWPQQ
jgi:uncharacterized membrane protein